MTEIETASQSIQEADISQLTFHSLALIWADFQFNCSTSCTNTTTSIKIVFGANTRIIQKMRTTTYTYVFSSYQHSIL